MGIRRQECQGRHDGTDSTRQSEAEKSRWERQHPPCQTPEPVPDRNINRYIKRNSISEEGLLSMASPMNGMNAPLL